MSQKISKKFVAQWLDCRCKRSNPTSRWVDPLHEPPPPGYMATKIRKKTAKVNGKAKAAAAAAAAIFAAAYLEIVEASPAGLVKLPPPGRR